MLDVGAAEAGVGGAICGVNSLGVGGASGCCSIGVYDDGGGGGACDG
jgi:hypothetical protein